MARAAPKGRLVAVDIDADLLSTAQDFVVHEREAAIRDLIADNSFLPAGRDSGSFRLGLSIEEGKLVLDVSNAEGEGSIRHILSLSPLRSVIKDYFLICDSYYAAVRDSSPSQIEAIDMGRRGVHNEGARILAERLEAKIRVDFDTARRLFTLVCALAWRG